MTDSPEAIAGVSNLDATGKQALVTGSTSGIGRETALALGRLGVDVIVHGRDTAAGTEVVDQLEATGVDATFFEADFARIDSVRDLFVGRLDIEDDESPVGERVWYRQHGG